MTGPFTTAGTDLRDFECPGCGADVGEQCSPQQDGTRETCQERVNLATGAMNDRLGDPPGDSPRCGHDPACPTPLHHERRTYRAADRWAIAAEEGLVSDDGARFAETSLADADPLPPPRYFDLGDATMLVRPGDLVFLHGMNAAGKSPTLDLIGRDHLQADRDCLWILFDYELGKSRQRERLLNAGWTPEEILKSIYYVEFPSLLDDQGKDRLVRDVLDKCERNGKVPRMASWDTFARSCSQMPGADPEKNQHINAWFTTHPDWLRTALEAETGVALTQYITDHPNKEDGIMPGGGHAKQDRVVIDVWLRRGTGFGKDHENGSTDFVIAKHAHGEFSLNAVVARLRNRIGPDGVSRFYRERADGKPSADANGDLNLDLSGVPGLDAHAEVLADLRQAGAAGIARSAVTGGGTRGKYRRKALDDLIHEGKGTESQVGRKKLCWAVEFASPW